MGEIIHNIKSFDADHSEVSPSSAHRWIHCPGSIKKKRDLQIAGTSSEAAAEGTAAHWVCETQLQSDNPEDQDAFFDKFLGKTISVSNTDIAGALTYYEFVFDKGLLDFCWDYVSYCMEMSYGVEFKSVEAKIPMNGILSGHDVDSHGYVDFLMVDGNTLFVTDLKFGKGVWVDVVDNPQLMLYALGAYHQFSMFFDIHDIKMCIHQPRMGNVQEHTITVQELVEWETRTVKPAVKAIMENTDEVCVGIDNQCKWCPVKTECKAYFEEITVDMFGPVRDKIDGEHLKPKSDEILTETEKVALNLNRLNIINWLNNLNKTMLSDAVENKQAPPGMKLVAGNRSRSWKDVDKADKAVARLGIPVSERRSVPTLKSPPQIEKIIGKKSPVMKRHVSFSDAKPTLVSEADKREPFEFEDVADDFNNI